MIEPMIEPTFVILGILASVAIPRLAATREDAEISAAVANLRTLVSDASAYYVLNGNFTGAKWNQITNVPLTNGANNNSGQSAGSATGNANLKVGNINDCITVKLVNKANGTGNNIIPAYIEIAKKSNANGVCAQVLTSNPLRPYFDSRVTGVNPTNGKGYIAIGSNTKIY